MVIILKIILTGGFTGGHIIPLIRLKKKYENEFQFEYVGFNGYLEEKLAKDNNISFIGLKKNKNILQLFIFIFKWFKILNTKIKKTDLIISSGGFHSFPLVLYARIKKIKYILIEENSKMGILNLLFKEKAYRTISNFPLKNCLYMLNPSVYFSAKPTYKQYDFLIIGGSLGSKILANLAIKLSKKKKVLLIAGRYDKIYKQYENSNLKVLGFVNVSEYYRQANIIICRAGSSTIFELIAINSCFILIPSMKTKRNHQYFNAKYINDNKLGLMIEENKIDSTNFYEYLNFDFSKIIDNQKKFINSFDGDSYGNIIRKAY